MAPPKLQGLNIVHPAIEADAQDLLSGQSFSDLSAQLDLWTNLSFDSDEPIGSRVNDDKYSRKSQHPDGDEEDDVRSPVTTEKAVHDGHINVVTGTNVGTNQLNHQPALQQQQLLPPFDLNAFLSGFGIDPYSTSHTTQQQQLPAPSLAQLLAFHSAVTQHTPGYPSTSDAGDRSSNFYSRTTTTTNHSTTPSTTTTPSSPEEPHPSTKRARSRKASISSVLSPETPTADSATGGFTSLSASEDKRRRNTAASARFRLKKKEREAALEGKAKELETRVSELERECEGLRRENGWLKGLVVGVTGAAQGPSSLVPPTSSNSTTTASSTGAKRRRDDPDTA